MILAELVTKVLSGVRDGGRRILTLPDHVRDGILDKLADTVERVELECLGERVDPRSEIPKEILRQLQALDESRCPRCEGPKDPRAVKVRFTDGHDITRFGCEDCTVEGSVDGTPA